MNGCWSEGDLRAWLDGELPPPDQHAVERHLAACPACAETLQALQRCAQRVSMLMGELAAPAPPATVLPVRRPSWRWTGIPAAIAAGLVLAFLLVPHRALPTAPPTPKTPPSPAVVPNTASVARPAPRPAAISQTRPRRAVPAKPPQQQTGEYYLALDDEPIDTGVVMRVALADNSQADVIFDSQGRARAIRPIKQGDQPW
jgi:anti-sigma factor RsiW